MRSPDAAGAQLGSLDSRLEFETLIVDMSAALFAAPPDRLERVVEDSLDRLRVFFQADRCGLLSVSPDRQAAYVRLASYADGISRVPPELNLVERFPWSAHELLDERRMVRVASPHELPAEAHVERRSWLEMPTRSGLMIPVASGGAVTDIIVLNTVTRERDWPDEFVTRLRVFGEMLVTALQRQEMLIELREAEERVTLAADSAEAGLWTLDYSTGAFWTTARTRALFGFAQGETVTVDLLKASIHPDDWPFVQDAIERSAGSTELATVEYRVMTAGGEIRWMSSRGRPQFDDAGKAERLTGVTIDITERRHVQEALRRSEARLQAATDLARLAFYEIRFDARTTYMDDRFRDLCGVSQASEQGMEPLTFWMEHIHPHDRARMEDARAQLFDGRLDRLSTEYRFLHPLEGVKWISHIACVADRGPDGSAVMVHGVLRDITQRKEVEEELHDLSRRLLRAHEEERSLLARELHDDVSQRLAVLAIDVGRAEMLGDCPAQSDAMRSAREGLVRLSEDVHSLAYQLHPAILEELGLGEALRAECERRGRQSGIALGLDLDAVPNVDKIRGLCLFRVTQEALSNVVRHSGATSATVRLRHTGGGLLLSVADRGRGFDPANPEASRRLGLVSMRERVELVNGRLDVISAAGQGTTIRAWVPTGEEAQ